MSAHEARPIVYVTARQYTADIVRIADERDPGRYCGRHRRLYGCDPEGWPDGLVHWSTSAQQWMRVTGYTDVPL